MGSGCGAQEAVLRALWWPGEWGWGAGKEAEEGGDVCTLTSEAQRCAAETDAL